LGAFIKILLKAIWWGHQIAWTRQIKLVFMNSTVHIVVKMAATTGWWNY